MAGLNKKIPSGRPDSALGLAMSDLLIWLVIVAVIVSVATKFVPHYLNHRTAVGIVERLVESPDSRGLDARELKTMIEKRFKMNSLNHFIKNGWVQVVSSDRVREINLDYEVRDELMVNIDFVIKFDDRVTLANQ